MTNQIQALISPNPPRISPNSLVRLQTTVLMDAWLKRKLAQNSMMFGHRVGAIPTNVIDANRRYLV